MRRSGTRFVANVRYSAHVAPIYERYVYEAFATRLVRTAQVIRRLQNGSLQTYLIYVFVALLVTLVFAR